jgi:hypothetical protein
MVFYMKILFSPGITLIKGSRPFPSAGKHDSWPSHGLHVVWCGRSNCASGNDILSLSCWLTQPTDYEGEFWNYPFTSPMSVSDADDLENYIESFAVPGQPQTAIGEQFNYYYRSQIWGKFDTDGWADYLATH